MRILPVQGELDAEDIGEHLPRMTVHYDISAVAHDHVIVHVHLARALADRAIQLPADTLTHSEGYKC